MISNQSLIENTLDMWLSQKQLEQIQCDWKAFCDDPVRFRGTVVVDMIKQDLAAEPMTRQRKLCT